jgi:hypothetical protein
MSAVVTVDPATGKPLAQYAIFSDADVDAASGTRASGYGRELAAAGIRGVVDVRTWWVLDAPAATAPASEWAA